MKSQKIVEVTWVDITSYSEWRDLKTSGSLSPTLIKSVGYLINKDKKNVRIAMSWSEDMGIAVTKVIPMGTVRKFRVIR